MVQGQVNDQQGSSSLVLCASISPCDQSSHDSKVLKCHNYQVMTTDNSCAAPELSIDANGRCLFYPQCTVHHMNCVVIGLISSSSTEKLASTMCCVTVYSTHSLLYFQLVGYLYLVTAHPSSLLQLHLFGVISCSLLHNQLQRLNPIFQFLQQSSCLGNYCR